MQASHIRLTPKPGPHEALDVLAADIVTDDLGPLARRGELRQQDVLDLRPGITLAEKEGRVLQIGPIDDVVAGQSVTFGQRDHDALAPETHDLPLARDRITRHDGDIKPASIDAGEQACACAFICLDFDLREPRRILDQAGPQVPGRQRGVESDREAAGLAPADFLGGRGHMIDRFDKMPRSPQYLDASRSQPNATAGSFEQHDAQTLFQLRNAAAQGRLLDPKRLSRPPKTAIVCSGDRIAQVSQFDLRFQRSELLL